MTIFARIQNGVIAEIIEPMFYDEGESAGQEVPIADRLHPSIVVTLVDITSVTPSPQCWWTAVESDGRWTFAAPAVG